MSKEITKADIESVFGKVGGMAADEIKTKESIKMKENSKWASIKNSTYDCQRLLNDIVEFENTSIEDVIVIRNLLTSTVSNIPIKVKENFQAEALKAMIKDYTAQMKRIMEAVNEGD